MRISTDPFAYASFNAFFTRALRAGTRPLAGDAATLVSPVDGTISQLGAIDDDRLLQAKGHHYTLDALLAGAAASGHRAFRGGSFATIYLAPYNYHRIHMPADGTLRETWYVPGRLFSVNAATAAVVPGLFARNERAGAAVRGPDAAPFAVIFVGALNVGSMATVWHGDVTPRRPRRVTRTAATARRRPLPRARRRDRPLQHGLDGDPAVRDAIACAGARSLPAGAPMRLGAGTGPRLPPDRPGSA